MSSCHRNLPLAPLPLASSPSHPSSCHRNLPLAPLPLSSSPSQPATVPIHLYQSRGLRLLSDIASHMQRCSRCFAVEEEFKHLKNGWQISSSCGSQRTSLFRDTLYIELTSDSLYFCLNCFKNCFSPTVDPEFKEGVVTEKVFQQNDMEGVKEMTSSVTKDIFRKKNHGVLLVKISKSYMTASKESNVTREEEVTSDKGKGKETEAKTRNEVCNRKIVGNNGLRKRKRSKGATQGGRCSRVNGRGWQCKETTLPGYALCEYHLGLARTNNRRE